MKKQSKVARVNRWGYIFLIPFFLTYVIFQVIPLCSTIYNSLFENFRSGLKQIGPNFVGFDNFLEVLKKNTWFDTETCATIGNTLKLWILNFIPQILLSLLLAAWFTDNHAKLKGQGAYKVIMYMPNIITAASVAVLFSSLFGTSGSITTTLANWGWIEKADAFMMSPLAVTLIIAFIQFWMWYGNTMIVLIAGILGISPSLYEAAMVDGATSRQQFFKITLPLLKPILQFTLVTSAIGGLQMYDIPALFNGGKPIGANKYLSTETTSMLIRTYFQKSQNFGKAAAVSVVLFVLTLVISMVFYIATKEKKEKAKHVISAGV
jgi:multiple sugar transport system permease protein